MGHNYHWFQLVILYWRKHCIQASLRISSRNPEMHFPNAYFASSAKNAAVAMKDAEQSQ